MTHRSPGSRWIAVAVAVISLWPVVAADQSSGGAKPVAPANTSKWARARTSDGQPDLQGFWTNTTFTPLERPKNVIKEFYTRAEAVEILKGAAALEADQTVPGTVADVHYDFTQFGLDRSQGPLALNLRTSQIVDPPDGRIPPMTPEGQKRAAERAAARKRMGRPTDAVQNQPLGARCIVMANAGPPLFAGAYNNNYQIVQSSGYVMVLSEMIHDARVIPLDGRPPLSQNVRQWMGSYRGRWEGETLVVSTTNFTDRTAFQGSSEHMRLTERFTRIDEDTIIYKYTVDDPATWTRPWSAEVPMKKTVGPLFEHACHEGNYGLYNILAGARAEEQKAAEESK
jgi:hypothetical protein